MRDPRLSIVLPFRDAATTLDECVDSVRGQTFDDWELLAVDDGSRDASAEVVARAAGEDPRIRPLRNRAPGLVGALNAGLRESRAPYVARMDADDRMRPKRLELQVAYLDGNPDVTLVACRAELFPGKRILAGMREYLRWQDTCVTPREIADNIYVEAPFAHPSVVFRREAVAALGGYREGPFPEDWDLWLRMHQAGLAMAKVPEVLLEWRESDARASRRDGRYSREAFDRLRAEALSRDPRLRAGRELAFWGAGPKTRKRARLLIDRGVRPLVWIDIDPRKIGKTLDGASVVGPERLERDSKPFVLVWVTNHGARDLIAERLASMGYAVGEDWLPVG